MPDFADTRTSTAGLGAVVGLALAAAAGGTVAVSVGGEQVTALAARGLTIAANDPVLIVRAGGQYVVTALIGTTAPVPPDIESPPPPKPASVSGTLVVAPVETRSYRPNYGWRTDTSDVYQGEYGSNGNHTGVAFYGAKPRSLDGATVTSATVRVQRANSGGTIAAQTSTLRLVTQATRPGGAPTLTSSTTGPRLARGKTDDSFDVPTAWAQEIVDGTAGGLAVYDASGSPYLIFDGKGSWGPAWTLTIRWTR